MRIVPLDARLGAEVLDVGLTGGLGAGEVAGLVEAFLAHHLLVFRAEPLPPADFARLGCAFDRAYSFSPSRAWRKRLLR